MTQNSNRLKDIRERLGMPQKEAAQKAGISVRHYQKFESDDGTLFTKARLKARQGVADAFGVSQDVLLGRQPIPDDLDMGLDKLARTQKNTRISRTASNAYQLVELRYNLPQAVIVELAPCITALVIQDYFRWRRERLNEARHRQSQLEQITKGHLSMASPYTVGDALDQEEASITANDVFGERLNNALNDNHTTDNPFISYLREMARPYDAEDLVGFTKRASSSTDNMPTYELFRKDARALAGGDEELTEAIMDGRILLHEMPAALRKSSSQDRQAWLREQLDKFSQDVDAVLEHKTETGQKGDRP